MTKILSLSLLACTMGTLASMGSVQAAELTARDLRMETRTQWDYQPLQGPRFRAHDRDIFTSGSNDAVSGDPLALPSSVEPGDYKDPPRTEDRFVSQKYLKDLRTSTSLEVGAQISSYHYHERDLGVKLQGPQGGVQVIATGAIGSQWFLRGDGRFTAGSLDYKGSGTMDTNPNYIGEARATIGHDFLARNWGVSPYVGIGYRYLHSDVRGVTTTGHLGYQRDSHYLFVPIGIQPRVLFPNGDKLTLTAEYDPLLQGWQESFLSDVSGYPDLTNKQKAGYGLRADLMYQRFNWAFGPYMNYWNINQSETECGVGTVYATCGYEPHNHTLEYGLQVRYKFFQD
ncbi:MAG: hypothetical protein PHD48_04615 [Alphaproteobacteria bacterium]|nr:hypothetical protein [Alphaproteobacteria bacterium]